MKTTRTDLLKKAIDLFKEQGYESVKITDICDALGVTKGSFFHHFSSKADVIQCWFAAWQEEMLRSMVEQSGDIWDFLRRYAEGITAIGPDLLYHMMITNNSNRECSIDTVSAATADAIAAMCKMVKAAQDRGDIASTFTPEELCKTYNQAYTGLIVEWYMRGGEFNFISRLHTIYRIIFCR